jgi:hypothetical protein
MASALRRAADQADDPTISKWLEAMADAAVAPARK